MAGTQDAGLTGLRALVCSVGTVLQAERLAAAIAHEREEIELHARSDAALSSDVHNVVFWLHCLCTDTVRGKAGAVLVRCVRRWWRSLGVREAAGGRFPGRVLI